MPERRAEKPPEGIAGESDCDEDQESMPKRLPIASFQARMPTIAYTR